MSTHSAGTLENAKQPAGTGCSASATLDPRCEKYTPATPLCQAAALDAHVLARLEKAGLETVGDVCDVLDGQGDHGLLGLDGIGAKTVEALKQALQARPSQPSLDAIQKHLDDIARDRALSLLADLQAAREEVSRGQATAAEQAAEVGAAVEQARDAVEAVDGKAEEQIERAFNLLGEDEQARTMVEQIIAARDLALLVAEANLESTALRFEALQETSRKQLSEARDMVDLLQEELDELVSTSAVAAEAAQEGREVLDLAALADDFTRNGHRSAPDLERLMNQLSRYAKAYPVAARALVSLEHHAETWFADQLREEIEGLVPPPSFPEELSAIVRRAEKAGVAKLIERAVEEAKARDRAALAEKGLRSRLYAKQLVETSRVEAGDLVAHRAGRVTVYRRQNGRYRITHAFVMNRDEGSWAWKEDASLIGRQVHKIRSQHTYQA